MSLSKRLEALEGKVKVDEGAALENRAFKVFMALFGCKDDDPERERLELEAKAMYAQLTAPGSPYNPDKHGELVMFFAALCGADGSGDF